MIGGLREEETGAASPGVRALLEANLADVRARVAAAAKRSGREPEQIRLVAVTKTVPASIVRILIACGARDLGESRLPQATNKIAEIEEDVRWHMIGHVQSRKVRAVVADFPFIHSVDSLRLAESVSEHAGRLGVEPQVFLQVNVSGEATKGGFSPDDLVDTYRQCRKLSSFRIRGLMTMAPCVEDPESVRPVFRGLRELRDELVRRHPEDGPLLLSMGMTQDFEQAIEEGADWIRVGTALYRGLDRSR
jgi:pyridoxal phosphate enzyme (YggS family)